MNFDLTQTSMTTKMSAAPRINILFLIAPLTVLAVWLAGVRPSDSASTTAVMSVLLVLVGGIVASWTNKKILCRLAAAIAIAAAAIMLMLQLGQEGASFSSVARTELAIELALLVYIALVMLLVSLRLSGTRYAMLNVLLPVQLIQYSVINLYSIVGGIPELGPAVLASPFSSSVHFMIGLALLVEAVMNRTASMDDARTWPKAAALSALLAIIVSVLVARSGFAAVVAAMSGTVLVALTFFACRASITRREMFRLHLKLRRKVRRQVQQQDMLLAAQADYEELFERVPIGVMKTVDTGRVISANQRMCEILGYNTVQQLIATDLRALFADPEKRRRDFMAWKNSGDREWGGDVNMLRQDGTPIIANFTGTRINDSRGNLRYVLSCYEDVTEQRKAAREIKKLESDLRLTHKLEAVGRLAAGVAHEINTPMQYIGDNVHFLSSAYEDLRALARGLTGHLRKVAEEAGNSRIEEVIEELEEEADLEYLDESVEGSFKRTVDGVRSVTDIVRSMKEFAYPNDKQQVPTDINGLIENTLTVSRSMYAAAATVSTELGELPATLCYPGELNQVFVNLVVNAAHAVEKANKGNGRAMGEIRIRTSVEDRFIRVDISDNGSGMPDAVRERIFDPFFTTKEVGKGTGQGLAIARSIVTDKHGGDISVTSVNGEGTTFTVKLPIRSATDI